MLNFGRKRPIDRVIKRPWISEECWQLDQQGDVDKEERLVGKYASRPWNNKLNKRIRRLNRFDYWED